MWKWIKKWFCGWFCDEVRTIPTLGRIVEQHGPVVKTCNHKVHIRNLIMAFEMTDSQQATLSVQFVDKKMNFVAVDGAPEWFTDNSEVLSVVAAADGMSCVIKAVGPLGNASVTLKADADMGEGLKPLISTFDVKIIGGEAAGVVITPSAPVEQA